MSDQTKSVKFTRLAEAHVNRAMKALGTVGNLANKQIYAHNEAQVKKIKTPAIMSRFEEAHSSRFGETGL